MRSKKLQTAGVICTIACAATIFTLSCIPSHSFPSAPSFMSHVIHFTEYLCLGVCLAFALSQPKHSWKFILLVAIIIVVLYGGSDELHQLLTPGRCCDWRDWLVDSVGGSIGVACTVWGMSRHGWFSSVG